MWKTIIVLTALTIYPTVCIEWVAEPGIVYNLFMSKDLVEWEVHPHYEGYTTEVVVTNRMWLGKDTDKYFFKLSTNGVVIR